MNFVGINREERLERARWLQLLPTGTLTLCLCILLAGCAGFQLQRYQTVWGGNRNMGAINTRTVALDPLIIKRIPTESAPYLEVYLPKKIARTFQYEKSGYREAVYVKPGFHVPMGVVDATGIGGVAWAAYDYVKGDMIDCYYVLLGSLGIASLLVLLHTNSQTKTVVMPGSGRTVTSTRVEFNTVPAAGEELTAARWGTETTNGNGLATFRIPPSAFDRGVLFRDASLGNEYLIRRIPKTRTVTRDWVPTVRRLGLALQAARKVTQLIDEYSAEEDPELLIPLGVELVGGAAAKAAIALFGTTTQKYYKWVMIEVRT